jgi:1-acyl-sn-glycerol-3-phosphate acyltransferase
METMAPVVPVAISGTERMMRKGSAAVLPGVARVQMLPAIEPEEFANREDLLRAVKARIAEALPEQMKPLEG